MISREEVLLSGAQENPGVAESRNNDKSTGVDEDRELPLMLKKQPGGWVLPNRGMDLAALVEHSQSMANEKHGRDIRGL